MKKTKSCRKAPDVILYLVPILFKKAKDSAFSKEVSTTGSQI